MLAEIYMLRLEAAARGGQGSDDQFVSVRPRFVARCEGVLRSEERHASDTQLLLTLSYNGSPGCRLMLRRWAVWISGVWLSFLRKSALLAC